MTSLIQGLIAMGFMVLTGNFSCSLPSIFWICLVARLDPFSPENTSLLGQVLGMNVGECLL